jgi:glycosyltransferase involved in cell wall biosynthesis
LAGERAPGIALYREKQHKQMKALAVRRALELSRRSKNTRAPVTWNVVVTCHNYGKYLNEAVTSVLFNDADYVVTIVDDASTDDTSEIGTRFSRDYAHVSYIRHDQNGGVSFARDSGVDAVDSEFVVFLDADDKIGSNYLFEAEKLLRSGCDVANPDAILFGDKSTRWRVPDETFLQMLLQRNSVHYCAAFRRCYWTQVGGIDRSMDYWQDYEFWIRVAKAGARIRRLPGDHFYYRKHGTSKSSRAAKIRDSLWAYIRQKHRALYLSHHSLPT